MVPTVNHPLLFIAADQREAEPWVARWNDIRALSLRVHWARAGNWRGREVIAIANGTGPQCAIAAVQSAQTIARTFSGICSIGTGGALDPSLRIADVVVATAVMDGKARYPALDPGGSLTRSGIVHTSPHIIRTAHEKSKLHQSGSIIVEMESGGVARVAGELSIPFYCVRVVSDLAGETFFTDFESFLMPDGRFSVPRLALHALVHPVKGLGELLRLQKRTSLAARRLAEFLDSCTF
jgi:adenosylhomocysteine nucleosidase